MSQKPTKSEEEQYNADMQEIFAAEEEEFETEWAAEQKARKLYGWD